MKISVPGFPVPRRLIWVFVLIGLLLVLMSGMIGYGYFIADSFQSFYSPLMVAIEEIEQETLNCHQRVHELSVIDPALSRETALEPLDEALREYQEVLAERQMLPFASSAALKDKFSAAIQTVDQCAQAYRRAVVLLLPAGGRTHEGRLRYDESYAAFVSQVDELEDLLLEATENIRLRFQNTMAGLIGLSFLLAVVVGFSIYRYEKHRKESYAALNDAHTDLTKEIDQRITAEHELKASEQLFRTVFRTSPDPIILTRVADSRIVDVNLSFTSLTGYPKEEVIGKTVLELEIWEDLDQRERLLADLGTTGAVRNREANFRLKDGRLLTTLMSAEVIEIGSKPHILSIVRDITDRNRDENRILAANRFLQIANRHEQIRPLLKEFLAEIKTVSGCEAAAVRILDEENTIPYAEADGFSEDFCSLEGPLSIDSDKGMCVRVMQGLVEPDSRFFTRYGSYFVNSTTRFLEMASEQQKGLMRSNCHRFGYETLALIPIRSADRTLGLIHIASKQADRLSADLIDMLEGAALQLGDAIQRALAEEALKQSHTELEKRVKKRTTMLSQTNDQLLAEIEERKKTEQELLDYQQRLRSLSSELIQTQEQERRLIATEIHDRIGQALAVSKIKLGSLKAALNTGETAENVKEVRDLITQTIRDTRTLTFELSPPVLYELGLQAALEWLAEFIRKQSGLAVKVAGDGSDEKLTTVQRVFLFRAVRELLYNTVKHAGAISAEISIGGQPSGICIEVADNGSGFSPRLLDEQKIEPDPAFGLFSIREQIRYYGGLLEINSAPAKGTQVNILLPLETKTS